MINNEKIFGVSRSVHKKIDGRYSSDKNKRTIAKESLALCGNWAIENGDILSTLSKEEAKKSCFEYVKKKIKDRQVMKSSIFLSLFFSFIVKPIILWVIEKYLLELLEDN